MNINLTLFAQLIAFAVFVWFTMKYVWPPIVNALEERKAKIADGLAAVEGVTLPPDTRAGIDAALGFFHDFSGLLLFMIAFVGLVVVRKLMRCESGETGEGSDCDPGAGEEATA